MAHRVSSEHLERYARFVLQELETHEKKIFEGTLTLEDITRHQALLESAAKSLAKNVLALDVKKTA